MQSTPLILGIHGLANKPPREEKQGWWKAAVQEGLRRNCGRQETDLPFDFVYWADLRYEAPLRAEDNHEPYYPDPGTGVFPTVAENAPEMAKTGVMDRMARGLSWLQERIGLAPVDDLLIEYRLDDLYGYLEDEGFRRAARNRLREAIEQHEGARILLAAHSMGSLIAYDVLRIMEREGVPHGVAHLLTMGAPLGLAQVKLAMAQEHDDLRVPSGLEGWSNLMDHSDVATLGEDVAAAYAPNGRGVRAVDVAVVNAYRRPDGARNHHKSYGYLRTPEFSRAVSAFLGSEAAGSFAPMETAAASADK